MAFLGRPRYKEIQNEENISTIPNSLMVYPTGANETFEKYAWLTLSGIYIGSFNVNEFFNGNFKETLPDAYEMLNEETCLE